MRRAATFLAIACAAAAVSGGASAETRFRGSFTLTTVKDCIARYVGETFNSAFRPASIGGNPNVTSLTQLNQYSGDVYEAAGLSFVRNVWVPLNGWGFDNLHYSFTARIKVTAITAPITPATSFVTMTGTIENMGNDPGIGGKTCIAGFRAAYFRRIE